MCLTKSILKLTAACPGQVDKSPTLGGEMWRSVFVACGFCCAPALLGCSFENFVLAFFQRIQTQDE